MGMCGTWDSASRGELKDPLDDDHVPVGWHDIDLVGHRRAALHLADRHGAQPDRISPRALLCSGSRCETTTKAIPLSGRIAFKNSVSASSPPADAPIPTTRKGFSGIFPLVTSGSRTSETGDRAGVDGL